MKPNPTSDRSWLAVLLVVLCIAVNYGAGLQEGEQCTHQGEPGVCTPYSRCKPTNRITVCRYSTQEAIVCCPQSMVPSGNSRPVGLSASSGFTSSRDNSERISAQNGDSCQYGNEPGICRGYSVCRPLLEVSRVVKICGYTPQQAIVCCPVDYEQRLAQLNNVHQRLSERKCAEYGRSAGGNVLLGTLAVGSSVVKHKERNRCPTDTNLIVGGTEARLGEFPHLVRLAMPNDNGQFAFQCGGTLISESWVLTAAHCVVTRNIVVRLGEVKENHPDYPEPLDVRVTEYKRHPEYKPRLSYHDIALLKLEQPVTFSRIIRPACLYSSPAIDRTKGVAIGFGAVETGGNGTKELLKVSLDLFETTACNVYFRNTRRVPQGLTEGQLCAGALAGGKDTCTGDSGGPLQIFAEDASCSAYIIGITSFGNVCGSSSPGVYTRVSSYIDWIESVVWPGN